ncbi:MAG: hypothetical protein KGI64_00080 [Xanthomonadaceae bacterium]|nr:hypothetical protein [Xanthomonadaceae bacterium]MDE1960359.1 hypothetical protein [Xanthomonadaceae bacterium]MDE2083239.1 hypothetical protein [Xanthomonadaceae bacterium]MDE2257389.1 hypothetical protein [Xanthomonadaceae bacterium]
MRQIFASPRIENVERIVAVLGEAGIETRVTNRRAYAGHDYKGPSYSAKQDQSRWPAVWIVNAEDQPRARAILRDIGLAPATRFADELAQAREPKTLPPRMALAPKLRIVLIGAIVLLILLRYVGIY